MLADQDTLVNPYEEDKLVCALAGLSLVQRGALISGLARALHSTPMLEEFNATPGVEQPFLA